MELIINLVGFVVCFGFRRSNQGYTYARQALLLSYTSSPIILDLCPYLRFLDGSSAEVNIKLINTI